MAVYIIRRLLLLGPTFLLITVISFFVMELAPGGPLQVKLRSSRGGSDVSSQSTATQEAREAISKLYGFDQPIHVQYLRWLKKVVTLDFGESLFEYRPVMEMIWERLGIALLFGVPSTIVAYVMSIFSGTMKAIKRDSVYDRLSTATAFLTYSIPAMVIGIVLIVVFSVKLDLLPVVGLHDDEADSLSAVAYVIDLTKHFILPFSCYILGSFAFLTELQKKSMLEELSKDYIRTARAKGLGEARVHFKHALRNAVLPIITSLRSVLVGFLGASFIVEMMFSIKGLGYLEWQALLNRDYPIIMANLTITAILGMLGTLMTDMLYTLVDPRIDFD